MTFEWRAATIKWTAIVGMMVLALAVMLGQASAETYEDGTHGKHTISVFIAGDSTASDYADNLAPRKGWGQMFGALFDGKITVVNKAASGRSSKSFIDEGRLDAVRGEMQKGDYLLIQFGHNDEKKEDASRYTEPGTTFKSYLKQYIDAAREKGAVPVLITPVERRGFTADGQVKDSHGMYPNAVRELGEAENVPVIDLTAKSKALYEELGPERTKSLFLWLNPGESTNYPNGVQDNTHFQENGAKQIAKLVAGGLDELKLHLRNHLVKELR
ncbi:rhamnogalacturonan acetylesterase [Paenibacillus sp. S-38]|uniref:rhamnogalacturonan acetylesterase n=1 Tax=Paenibacillus sp. S-38 TaxID=3416710 RepID=UPI003CF2823E